MIPCAGQLLVFADMKPCLHLASTFCLTFQNGFNASHMAMFIVSVKRSKVPPTKNVDVDIKCGQGLRSHGDHNKHQF